MGSARSPDERSDIRDVTRQSHLRHLSPRAGRGRFASGAMAKRSKSGGGACPRARTRGYAPLPGFLRCARNPTSPRKRGEVEQAVRALPPPSSEAYAIALPLKGNGARFVRAGWGSICARERLERNLLPTVEQHSYRPRDPARRNNNWRKLMRSILAAGLIAAGAWCVGASPSVAAPANGVALGDAAGELGIAESVHCRRYVHWPSWGRGTGGGRRGAVVIHEGVRVRRPGVRVRVHTGDRVRSSTSIRSRESTTVRSREGATVRGGREGGGATIRSGQDGGGRTGQGGAAQRERSGGGGQTGTSGAGGGGGGGGSSTGSTGQGGASGGGASGAGGAGGGSR